MAKIRPVRSPWSGYLCIALPEDGGGRHCRPRQRLERAKDAQLGEDLVEAAVVLRVYFKNKFLSKLLKGETYTNFIAFECR
jgi:hypothetical protein